MEKCYTVGEIVNCLYLDRSEGYKHRNWTRFHRDLKLNNLEGEFKAFKVKDLKSRGRYLDFKDALVKDSKISHGSLRDIVRKHGILGDNCEQCGLGSWWNGKKLVLQVDHVDGNNKNNELSNLRYLCPTCHSQTITFCRGLKNYGRFKKPCKQCGNLIKPSSNLCRACRATTRGKHKINLLSLEDLKALLQEYAMMEICKFFSCAYLSFDKLLIEKNLDRIPYGDWTSIRRHRPMDLTLIKSILKKYNITSSMKELSTDV